MVANHEQFPKRGAAHYIAQVNADFTQGDYSQE